jgi:PTS system nitrogen regulatory IIA component
MAVVNLCYSGAEVETYLTVDELAEYLKLNAQTIQRWVRNRVVPFHKVKSVIRFRVSEIEKWVDECGLVSQEGKPENIEAGLFDGDSSPDELGQLGEKGAGE